MELYNKRSWYVLAVVLVISTILYFNIGWFTKFAWEQLGKQVLGTSVSIGALKIDASKGSAVAEDIKIYNPKEYRQYKKHALTIDKVNINTKELRKGLVVFEDISVKGVNVYLVADERDSNFAIFRNNIKKYIDVYVENYNPDDRGAPDIIMDKIKIEDSKLHPLITISSKYIEPVKVSDIEINDIGKDINGIRTKRAISLIWLELTNAAINASADKGLFSNIPHYQRKRIQKATELPEYIGEGGDKTIKVLFGRE